MTAWKLADNYSDHWTDLLHAKVECRQRGEHPWHTLLYHSPIRKKVKYATKNRAANNNSLDSDWSAPVNFLTQRHQDHYSYKMWLPGGGQYLTRIRLTNQLSLSRKLFCCFEHVKMCSSLLERDECRVCLPITATLWSEPEGGDEAFSNT